MAVFPLVLSSVFAVGCREKMAFFTSMSLNVPGISQEGASMVTGEKPSSRQSTAPRRKNHRHALSDPGLITLPEGGATIGLRVPNSGETPNGTLKAAPPYGAPVAQFTLNGSTLEVGKPPPPYPHPEHPPVPSHVPQKAPPPYPQGSAAPRSHSSNRADILPGSLLSVLHRPLQNSTSLPGLNTEGGSTTSLGIPTTRVIRNSSFSGINSKYSAWQQQQQQLGGGAAGPAPSPHPTSTRAEIDSQLIRGPSPIQQQTPSLRPNPQARVPMPAASTSLAHGPGRPLNVPNTSTKRLPVSRPILSMQTTEEHHVWSVNIESAYPPFCRYIYIRFDFVIRST